MNKEEAKAALIEVLMNQVVDLTMMSKIELGDDVIEEIKRLKAIINESTR
jgi:alpha-N-acetylglucosamine transferase